MADDGSAGNWCLIESDPGVFTEMVQKMGVKGVQFEEIYSLSKDLLAPLNPVYGLIFLFKWVKDDKPQGTVVKDSRLEEIFFPKQVHTLTTLLTRPKRVQVLLDCFTGGQQCLCHTGHHFLPLKSR